MTERTTKVDPLVSVVIATRNCGNEVQLAVESCLFQDYAGKRQESWTA